MNKHLASQLQHLPTEPGIYKYFNADNEIIYVGKAVNLKNRVKSYFFQKDIAPRTKVLVSQIDRLEYIVVQSEMDALILEANLIKEYRPRFNIILKDDKSHLYIKITLYADWPRISTCRATDIHLDPKATYFGPFPSGRIVKDTLRSLRKVFPNLAHNQPPVSGRRRPPQSYFYYNLPLTSQSQQPNQKEYRRQIFQLVHFLEGKRQAVVAELEKNMHQAAKQLNFEQAAEIKRQLEGMTYVTQRTISPESYLTNPELMADKRAQGLRELSGILSTYWSRLKLGGERAKGEVAQGGTMSDTPPFSLTPYPLQRIECFDISNISGQYAVGSMVVFVAGEASKPDYRKFRIQRQQAPNDVAMMTEVLSRRFKRLQDSQTIDSHAKKVDESFSAMPNLIMVDGGKGQLAAAQQVLNKAGLAIPVVGMTKREEELVVPISNQQLQAVGDQPNIATHQLKSTTKSLKSTKPKRSAAHGAIAKSTAETQTQVSTETNFVTIRLARGSEALFMVQRLRDEAHRFAITYHRKLRAKGFIQRS